MYKHVWDSSVDCPAHPQSPKGSISKGPFSLPVGALVLAKEQATALCDTPHGARVTHWARTGFGRPSSVRAGLLSLPRQWVFLARAMKQRVAWEWIEIPLVSGSIVIDRLMLTVKLPHSASAAPALLDSMAKGPKRALLDTLRPRYQGRVGRVRSCPLD